jgi:hypothetical protein
MCLPPPQGPPPDNILIPTQVPTDVHAVEGRAAQREWRGRQESNLALF